MLRSVIESQIRGAFGLLGVNEPVLYKVEVPPRRELGDYATNAAIVNAKALKKPPLQIAKELVAEMEKLDQGGHFVKIEIAPPGFINFFLSDRTIEQRLKEVIPLDQAWGRSALYADRSVLLEYVSANPTGPLHVGHGRWAVFGDCLARLFEAVGYRVEKEFYVNNVGNQVEKLYASVLAARSGQPTPENGYGGAYVKEIKGETIGEMLACNLEEQKQVLSSVGVVFDRFFFENELHDQNLVMGAVDQLKNKHQTFEEGGAIWFKSQEHGDDKNRVLVREDGKPTYFAADIAYHLNKFNRGYDLMIDIWGTDHHGYVQRLKAALKAIGLPAEKLEIIIGQLVALYRGDEQVRMSKRTGEMVALKEVVEEIGADATRFFFAATDVNSHLDFDLELAKKRSSDNPVFYLQYGHARICGILRKGEGSSDQGIKELKISELSTPAERNLIMKLIRFPEVVYDAAQLRHPHRICEYGKELAALFHSFYEQCKVLGNPSREYLVGATRITLRNVLNLLGITAPESM
ncbi:MAG: arginine--tRNA ligase [Candidatus Margulisbacteria bacterium]|nr:arginine--tRNA ligase [Candidatus Margulisiibacteriota bacterium]MBU1616834.1 arginine--tRNA ligase [Candidatus Margulisiibacteriota bacterium]